MYWITLLLKTAILEIAIGVRAFSNDSYRDSGECKFIVFEHNNYLISINSNVCNR